MRGWGATDSPLKVGIPLKRHTGLGDSCRCGDSETGLSTGLDWWKGERSTETVGGGTSTQSTVDRGSVAGSTVEQIQVDPTRTPVLDPGPF